MKSLRPILVLMSILTTVYGQTDFSALPSVVINHQGLAQQDFSFRGSDYTGTGLSLNGLTLKVPYSAHYNAEHPFPRWMFSNPTLQTGLENGSSHPIGNITFGIVPQTNHLQITSGIGTRESYSATASAAISGMAAFGEWEKARRIDHAANGLERQNGGVALQHFLNDWQLDLMAGHQNKTYGIQGYYGEPPNVYAEAQTEDNLLLFSAFKGELDNAFLRVGIAGRQFDDRYLVPSLATDRSIRSRYATLAVEGRTLEIQHLVLNLRGDLEHERVSGDIDNKHRTRGSIQLLPEARFDRFAFKAGFNSVFESHESTELLPQTGIDFHLTDNNTLFAAYSESVHQPDYQSLADNPMLRQQKISGTELGFRQFISAYLDWRTAAFQRRIKNSSDRIGGTLMDLGHLEVYGLDAAIRFYPSENLNVQLYYQWLHKDNDLHGGLYETDYPEHLLALSGRWRCTEEWSIQLLQQLRQQTGNNARSGTSFGAEASLGLHYEPRFAKNTHLSFLVENLFGSDFQPIPGLKPRPTSFSAGITVNW